MMKTTCLAILLTLSASPLPGHPLGIFSVNRYARIELAGQRIVVVYVVDVAEIPSIREISEIDVNRDRVLDDSERNGYAERKIRELRSGLCLTIDGEESPLECTQYELTFPEGQGGLKTTRLSLAFKAPLGDEAGDHVLSLVDGNFTSGLGWKEMIVRPTRGEVIRRSSVPRADLTDELRSYPQNRLSNPPAVEEATVEFSEGNGVIPDDASDRGLAIIGRTKDAFAELISPKDLSLPVMLFSIMLAIVLGAGHALTPGHGKTVVAAYLVGSRGTVKDAAFLGLTVTATHTVGVFAMGLVSLIASRYIVPDNLYPWLSLLSGVIVASMGLSLVFTRIRHARAVSGAHAEHTHGGHTHSHIPEVDDHARTTWRRLLALGVSGGLLPCPSAIVVMLAAIALGRIVFGLLLIVAFSIGLAGVLTGVGILMVHARRVFDRFNVGGPFLRWLPVLSALVVTAAGIAIAGQAIAQTSVGNILHLLALAVTPEGTLSASILRAGALPVLSLGFVLGLKHALDADHLVAVSTIVSERKGFLSSSIVGALWGLGHTASLVVVGLLMIALHIDIPEKAAQGMEFAVALMLVFLGTRVFLKLFHGGRFHLHPHSHQWRTHAHPHVHGQRNETEENHHHTFPSHQRDKTVGQMIVSGKRSIFIGMVHGLAGSAALMLIVLAAIPSASLALVYVGVFGLGSIGGMVLMSTMMGIPFIITAGRSERLNTVVRGLSGFVSLAFGLFLAWQIGIVGGLFV